MLSSRRRRVVPVSMIPSMEELLKEPLPTAYPAPVNSQKPFELSTLFGDGSVIGVPKQADCGTALTGRK